MVPPDPAALPSPAAGEASNGPHILGLALAQRLVRQAQIEALDVMDESVAATKLVSRHFGRF